jgi:hypothetical protein
MKLIVLYRPESEFSRAVETFVTDFNRLHEGIGRRVEVLNVDTRDGMALMSLYDIMEHPVLMVLSDDGQQVKSWAGPQLPLMDEVASYFYTAQTQ